MTQALAIETGQGVPQGMGMGTATLKPVPDSMKQRRSWTACPDGMPSSLDLEALGKMLVKVGHIKRLAAKHPLTKALRRSDKKQSQAVALMLPMPKNQILKLPSRQLWSVALMASGDCRQHYSAACFDTEQPDRTVEVWLLNSWIRSRIDKTMSVMDMEIREEGASANGLISTEDPGLLDGVDALMGGLISPRVDTGLEHVIRGMIGRGWIKQMYQDLYDQGKHADKASLAIYALASWLDSRIPLDVVYEHSEEIFKKHYGNLVYCELHDYLNARAVGDVIGEHKPLDYSLLSPESIAMMNFVALKPLVKQAGEGLLIVTDLLDPDKKCQEALIKDYGNLIKGRETFEHGIRMFGERVDHLARVYSGERLRDLVSQVVENHKEFCAIYTEYDSDKSDTASTIRELVDLSDTFIDEHGGRPAPGREAEFMASISHGAANLEDDTRLIQEVIQAGEKIRTEIARLAAEDPLRNRDLIQSCYEQLEERKADLNLAEQSIGRWARQTVRLVEAELVLLAELADEQSPEPAPGDDDALLTAASEENAELQAQNMELKSRVESLEVGLAAQKNDQATSGMSDEVREALHAMMAGNNTITPSQCLLATKAMYPSTEILPSAWSSAREASAFEQTDRLSESLFTLAGKYTDAINTGTADAEARRMFTAFQYAANESETTSGGRMRKHREFRYQGETVYFDQHLRFGVAQNVRTTLRLHFKIIDGVLVIAYCGEHRKL